MFVILIIISTVIVASALNPAGTIELAGEKVRNIISTYISKIPDIEEQYIVDERLSKSISHYFSGKISSFPLYKISLKIDRNPIKIPWTLEEPYLDKGKKKPRVLKQENQRVQKRYKHLRSFVTKETTALTKKPVENKDMSSGASDSSSRSTSTSDSSLSSTSDGGLSSTSDGGLSSNSSGGSSSTSYSSLSSISDSSSSGTSDSVSSSTYDLSVTQKPQQ